MRSSIEQRNLTSCLFYFPRAGGIKSETSPPGALAAHGGELPPFECVKLLTQARIAGDVRR
ncbi:MAG: hypothetical protein JSV80_16735 [Acidobacteriota bacterium]|nr:MAG: hypothetical protein JSV80_16735 [Acidobacteriota bacterium]